MEVEGVRVAAGRERAERDRAEAAEGTVVDRGAAVDILVHLQVQLARKSRATGSRAGQGVGAGQSSGIGDCDRAGGRVADLHRRGAEDGSGARAAHGQRARGERVGSDRGRGRREVGEGTPHRSDRNYRNGREAEEDLRQWELLEHCACQSFHWLTRNASDPSECPRGPT